MKLRTLLLILVLAMPRIAYAQSSPNFTFGQVLTPQQWNAVFQSKNDTLGFTPLNAAGGVMTGRLVTAPVSSTTAGFNLTCGSPVPASPINGDVWCTSAGLFVQINGGTVGPLASTVGPSTFTGQITTQGLTTTSPGWYAQITGDSFARVRVGLNATDVSSIAFGPGNVARDAFIERVGPGSLRFGTADAALPVAQTFSVQNVAAGTSNVAGANFTIDGSQGTGTGCGGSILFKTAAAGSSGTTQNALSTALTLDCTQQATFAGPATFNSAITYGGVTLSNSVTGTGPMVLGTGPTIAGGALSGTFSGTPAFSGANFVTLANIVQDATAWSLLGNATSGTANYSPFTIPGLTAKSTPVGADQVMIADSAAAGAFKVSTLTQIIGAVGGGVTSIDTQTGAFTTSNGIDSISKVIEISAGWRTSVTVCAGFSGGTCPTSGTNIVYTAPANVRSVEWIWTGGGGGGGGGNNVTPGTSGGSSCLNTSSPACTSPVAQATGGTGGNINTATTPGVCTGANFLADTGTPGILSTIVVTGSNGNGGNGGSAGMFGGGGVGTNAAVGGNAPANSGSGGGGGDAATATTFGGGGGASGGICHHILVGVTPGATYSFTCGTGGSGAAAGSGGTAGGNGAACGVKTIEHYGTW